MEEGLDVVLVSNRGPVSFASSNGGYDIKRGAGGLAGALDPIARRLGDAAIWIAAATSATDREALHAGAADGLRDELGYPVYLLDIAPETYREYYDVVSNRMLWFANHCLWDELGIAGFGEDEIAAFNNGYTQVNRSFADAVLETAAKDSLVLLQDYHLTLAPGFLRAARPDQVIFHFTHSSFCAAGLERLPDELVRRVVTGMLGADLIGFHTAAWTNEFLTACEWVGAGVDRSEGVVEHGGRRAWVRPYPIPIDVSDLRTRADGDAARSWAERFEQEDVRLIVRADRTEPSKNIVRGFEALGRMLDRRDDLRGTVRFIANLYPSRQTMPEYVRYCEELSATADAINARHPGSIDLYLKDDYDRTVGALCVYDVLLVNSIMDGMNLVSKEGPAVNRRAGALVLSKGSGSFEELGDLAVSIDDATDVEATTAALEYALELALEEREQRAAGLRARVEDKEPEDWIEAQLEDLVAIRDGGEPLTPPPKL